MKQGQQLSAIAISLLTVAALGAGLYWFIAALIEKLASVSSDVSKAVIAGGAAVIGSVLTLVAGKLWEQRIKIRQELRAKKIPIYEQQVETLFDAMFAAKLGKPGQSQKKLEVAFVEFTEKLLIWGSSDVISSWQAFRAHDWENQPKSEFGLLEDFILTLRKDIGNENSKLKEGDLLRLFITDYDAAIARR